MISVAMKWPRAFPAALLPLPEGHRTITLIFLARWLIRPDHPLTARVAVNRWWEMFLNRLPKRRKILDSRSITPSHPNCSTIWPRNWSTTVGTSRTILKQIVLSATYGQSSRATKRTGCRYDPHNWLLGTWPALSAVRFNRFATSVVHKRPVEREGRGTKREALSTRRPMGRCFRRTPRKVPARTGGWHLSAEHVHFLEADLPAAIDEHLTHPIAKCAIRRARTNTPLQALVLMNDPTYVEAAKIGRTRDGGWGNGRRSRAARLQRRATLARLRPDWRLIATLTLSRWVRRATPADAEKVVGGRSVVARCTLIPPSLRRGLRCVAC